MTRTTTNSGKAAMRAVGMLACALSIVFTLAGVARSGGGGSRKCVPSQDCFFNSTAVPVDVVPVGTQQNGTLLDVFCLRPGDKRSLKKASDICDSIGRACCLEGELKPCPTAKPYVGNSNSNSTNICDFTRCSLGQRPWLCRFERDDD